MILNTKHHKKTGQRTKARTAKRENSSPKFKKTEKNVDRVAPAYSG